MITRSPGSFAQADARGKRVVEHLRHSGAFEAPETDRGRSEHETLNVNQIDLFSLVFLDGYFLYPQAGVRQIVAVDEFYHKGAHATAKALRPWFFRS